MFSAPRYLPCGKLTTSVQRALILQKIAILRTYAEETLNPREEPQRGAVEPADAKADSDDELRIDNESGGPALSPPEEQGQTVSRGSQSTETAQVTPSL